MLAIIKGPPGTHQKRIDALFVRIKAWLSDLEAMAEELEAVEENGVYRFYHGSYKVFDMQEPIKEAFKLIVEIGGEDDPPHFDRVSVLSTAMLNKRQPHREDSTATTQRKPMRSKRRSGGLLMRYEASI